jgi:hypothetical protein
MKRLILASILAVTSVCSSADEMSNLIPMGKTSIGSSTVKSYIIKNTWQKISENIRRGWIINDESVAQDNGDGKLYNSDKDLEEIDCKNNMFRTLEIIAYSGNLGEGDVVFNSGAFPGPWHYNNPGSVGHYLADVICSVQNN